MPILKNYSISLCGCKDKWFYKKSLTNHEGYLRLLYIIGKSKQPLPSTQIISEFGSKYAYEMLKELCSTEYTIDQPLFILEELKANHNYSGGHIVKN